MNNSKWLRRALLGGVALSVMTTGAQADELSALKAQLEALQARVNTIESRPAPALPANASYMTYSRGSGNNNFGNESKKDSINVAQDRGFTVAITPTADLPAPVAEVTVYGYVKGDVIFDTDDFGFTRSFTNSARRGDKSQITLHANQSRFGIRSRVDTAVGQIRTVVEGDFEGSPYGSTSNFRLRHAYGQWDMTPNWTLTVGQYWHIAALLPIGVTTVDFAGPASFTYSRAPQVRLDYKGGPVSWGFGIERPFFNNNTSMPNFAGYIQYDAAGGHQFIVTGEIADFDSGGGTSTGIGNGAGWVVQAGTNINLADVATLTASVVYGEGLVRKFINGNHLAGPTHNARGNPAEAIGFQVGLNFSINDTTSANVVFGYADNLDRRAPATQDDVMTVHANILWQPVRQMRLGWEVMWGNADYVNAADESHVRAQFGAWFFF